MESLDSAAVPPWMSPRSLLTSLRRRTTAPSYDIYGVGVAQGGRIPLVQVPTTAGTGSEVTQISVVKRSETVKAGIVSPTLLPDWAVLDGALTTSVPQP